MNKYKLEQIWEELGEIIEIADLATVTPDDDFAKIKKLCDQIVDATKEIRINALINSKFATEGLSENCD